MSNAFCRYAHISFLALLSLIFWLVLHFYLIYFAPFWSFQKFWSVTADFYLVDHMLVETAFLFGLLGSISFQTLFLGLTFLVLSVMVSDLVPWVTWWTYLSSQTLPFVLVARPGLCVDDFKPSIFNQLILMEAHFVKY